MRTPHRHHHHHCSCAQTSYLLPVLLACLLAYSVANIFTISMYDMLLTLSGLPYLPRVMTSASYHLTAGDIMRPLPPLGDCTYLTLESTYEEARVLLSQAQHTTVGAAGVVYGVQTHTFPLVDSHSSLTLIGSVSRAALEALFLQARNGGAQAAAAAADSTAAVSATAPATAGGGTVAGRSSTTNVAPAQEASRRSSLQLPPPLPAVGSGGSTGDRGGGGAAAFVSKLLLVTPSRPGSRGVAGAASGGGGGDGADDDGYSVIEDYGEESPPAAPARAVRSGAAPAALAAAAAATAPVRTMPAVGFSASRLPASGAGAGGAMGTGGSRGASAAAAANAGAGGGGGLSRGLSLRTMRDYLFNRGGECDWSVEHFPASWLSSRITFDGVPDDVLLDLTPDEQRSYVAAVAAAGTCRAAGARLLSLRVDPAPFQVAVVTPLPKLHYLFAICLFSHIYVTHRGALVGVVRKDDLSRAEAAAAPAGSSSSSSSGSAAAVAAIGVLRGSRRGSHGSNDGADHDRTALLTAAR
jgi:hypothetical protein